MKIRYQQILQWDNENDACFIRELEMAVDLCHDNIVGITIQFFRDLKLYGIDEAVQYLQSYIITDVAIKLHVLPIVTRIKAVLEPKKPNLSDVMGSDDDQFAPR